MGIPLDALGVDGELSVTVGPIVGPSLDAVGVDGGLSVSVGPDVGSLMGAAGVAGDPTAIVVLGVGRLLGTIWLGGIPLGSVGLAVGSTVGCPCPFDGLGTVGVGAPSVAGSLVGLSGTDGLVGIDDHSSVLVGPVVGFSWDAVGIEGPTVGFPVFTEGVADMGSFAPNGAGDGCPVGDCSPVFGSISADSVGRALGNGLGVTESDGIVGDAVGC